MQILHIDCSPRPESHSRLLSAAIVDKLLTMAPDADIRRRDLGYAPLPHARPDYATVLATPASLQAAGRSSDALQLSEQLIGEVEEADVIVIGTPMNNLTIPSVLKAWLDQILRVDRTMQSTPDGKLGMLRDRPVFVAIASGGRVRRRSRQAAGFPHALPVRRTGMHRHPYRALPALAGHRLSRRGRRRASPTLARRDHRAGHAQARARRPTTHRQTRHSRRLKWHAPQS
nr:NAD(P)H-dependent oxidoreductase [Burkholderia gladioli]